ncbi:hypothetical protein [Peterkaempfera griseoplana]|uniref:hypothetical protein n=1 Tax=Peterkaempfera griseoplana TaxID=66896 RepID=UPI0006E206F5|nr:hypothetical protein [Peterkaempfera griseoplana]
MRSRSAPGVDDIAAFTVHSVVAPRAHDETPDVGTGVHIGLRRIAERVLTSDGQLWWDLGKDCHALNGEPFAARTGAGWARRTVRNFLTASPRV